PQLLRINPIIMETFPIPPEEYMRSELAASMDRHNLAVQAIIAAMAEKGNELINAHDEPVRAIKRAMKRGIKDRSKRSTDLVADLKQPRGYEAGQRLDRSQAIVDQVTAYALRAPQVMLPGGVPAERAAGLTPGGPVVPVRPLPIRPTKPPPTAPPRPQPTTPLRPTDHHPA